MVEIVYQILGYTGVVLGIVIIGYGIITLIKKETVLVNKDFQTKKLTGKDSIKYGIYYIVGGLIWLWFSIAQLTGFFN